MKRIVAFVALALFITMSCHHDKDIEISNSSPIPVEPGTTSLVLSIENPADHATVPVVIGLPSNRSTPFKAVVVMHGSGGLWVDKDTNGDGIADVCDSREMTSQFKAWKTLLTNNNMVAAFPDGYTPRHTCENEGVYKNPPYKFLISGTFIRNRDAYAVLDLLRNLVWADTKVKVVDGDNIALLGFSDGGTAVISSLYDASVTPANWAWSQTFDGVKYTNEVLPPVERPVNGRFKTGVIYYPGAYHNSYYGNLCKAGEGIYKSYCDVLGFLAGKDPLTENAECWVSTNNARGGKTTIYRYANAGHSFDGNEEPQSTQARDITIKFLKEKLSVN